MKSIQIAYGLRIHGLQFNEINFADTTPEFKNITLRPSEKENCKYELLVTKNIFSIAPSQLKAIFYESSIEAEKFKYVFSISADIKIFDFECLGYYSNNTLTKYHTVFGGGMKRSFSATGTVTAGDPSAEKVKEKMKEKYDLSVLQMYYDSATIVEPISQFISLYTLLLHKYSDKQENVDKAILGIDPTIIQFKSPKFNRYETIFTKLRNEMSHKRDGINILETHDEIKLNMERFEEIVKELFLEKP